MSAYNLVTTHIIDQLEQGVIPWRRSWKLAVPRSYSTRKPYRGINHLILGSLSFSSAYWVTFKQAVRDGGHVRKGEKSMPVVFWHWRTEEEKARLVKEGKCIDPAPCIPFIARVFNLHQVDGLIRPEDDVPTPTSDDLASARALLSRCRNLPEITHRVGADPAYCMLADKIELPFASQFSDLSAYYATLFHEIVHATGHRSRLNRFDTAAVARQSAEYSFEELVAELGAAFLCAQAGIASARTLTDSASYIAGWISYFRGDKMALLRAAGMAQRAVDFLLGDDHSHLALEGVLVN